MIQALKGLLGLSRRASSTRDFIIEREAPEFVAVNGNRLDFRDLIDLEDGLPHVNWDRVHDWCDGFEDKDQGGEAWLACERAWLLHLRDALGAGYRLYESDVALLLTRQEDRAVDLTLAFIARTSRRVQKLLGCMAETSDWGRDILIAFDDPDAYYRYVAAFYPPNVEIRASAGMYLHGGCCHFISIASELDALEPTIVHEMTHAMLAHLPLPAWLNEGIAVNVEHRLAGGAPTGWDLRERVQQHRAFWTPENIQTFWSGQSYRMPGRGISLSYDLGRILVETLGRDWPRFEHFVLAAHWDDAGDAAAREELAVDLGAFVCSFMRDKEPAAWRPRPESWTEAPERGGF